MGPWMWQNAMVSWGPRNGKKFGPIEKDARLKDRL